MTTIWYPDVSNHQGNMALEAGTVAVCAKVSEGTGYADPYYNHFKSEAHRVGAVFFGYHFLHGGNGAAQARFCFGLTGSGVNVMVDSEPIQDPTGKFISKPTLQDVLDFAHEYRSLGGLCTLDYLPAWYHLDLGEPSLDPLTSAGLHLVSSDYEHYTDFGPGWKPYYTGAPVPAVWQYTQSFPYSGQPVDFNAYRGTVEQFKQLLGYSTPPAPAPIPPLPPITQEEIMQLEIWECDSDPKVYAVHESGKMFHVADPGSLTSINVNKPVTQKVSAETLANLKAALGYTGV